MGPGSPLGKLTGQSRIERTRQGYATEAVRGIIAFAFETLSAQRVEIRCASENRPSARVAEGLDSASKESCVTQKSTHRESPGTYWSSQ